MEAAPPDYSLFKSELAYRHIVALGEMFSEWSLDSRLSREQRAKVVGWAAAMETLADVVGPTWNPPAPSSLSAFGFLGRRLCGELSVNQSTT